MGTERRVLLGAVFSVVLVPAPTRDSSGIQLELHPDG